MEKSPLPSWRALEWVSLQSFSWIRPCLSFYVGTSFASFFLLVWGELRFCNLTNLLPPTFVLGCFCCDSSLFFWNLLWSNCFSIRKEDGKVFEKGVVRYLCIIVDMSTAMNRRDLKPSRWALTVEYLEEFIREYFDQNPLSQMCIIATYHSKAEKLTELSGK